MIYIHTCNDRMWYVDRYLVPSLLQRKIPKKDINIICDVKNEGNLAACMRAFKIAGESDGDSWHIQDDVIISKYFKRWIDELKNFEGIICGFSSHYDNNIPPGITHPGNMWYSFPCIRIPNILAKECAEHYYTNESPRRNKKCDDVYFRNWLIRYHPDVKVYNLMPNIVNHIDYLIGGSIANKSRGVTPVMSRFWGEHNIIQQLVNNLKEAGDR